MKKKYNVEPSEIKHIRLSSKLIFETDKGEIRLPLSEVSNQIMPSCRKCTDFTAELADISIGGAFPLTDWSTVIIRTKDGADFFSKAVENGVINTRAIEEEPTVIEHAMFAALQKRESGLKKAKEMEETSGYLPALLLRETDALAGVKIADIMTKNIEVVTPHTTVSQLLDLVMRCGHIAYPLIDDKNELVGWVTFEEASKVYKSKRDETFVTEIVRRDVVVAHPDETALDAFKRMSEHEIGRVIVLDRDDPTKIVGIVTKADLMHTLTKQ
jgi:CBS domain-containing protein